MVIQRILALLHRPNRIGVDVWSGGSPTNGPRMSSGTGIGIGRYTAIRQALCQPFKGLDQYILAKLLCLIHWISL